MILIFYGILHEAAFYWDEGLIYSAVKWMGCFILTFGEPMLSRGLISLLLPFPAVFQWQGCLKCFLIRKSPLLKGQHIKIYVSGIKIMIYTYHVRNSN